MPSKRRINVTIKADGSIIIAPSGYTGGKCKDATRNLEKEFGGPVKMKRTAEWNQKEIETEQQRQQG